MTLAVIGSRSFTHYASFCKQMDYLARNEFAFTHLISGGAMGTDRLAERYAAERKLTMTVLKPNWSLHGRKAGFLRNMDIINACDYVIAFWDGSSPGTKHGVSYAQRKGKSCKKIYISAL